MKGYNRLPEVILPVTDNLPLRPGYLNCSEQQGALVDYWVFQRINLAGGKKLRQTT